MVNQDKKHQKSQSKRTKNSKPSCLKVIVLLILFVTLTLTTLLSIISYDLLQVANNSALQKNALDEIVIESGLIYQWLQSYATQKLEDGSVQGESGIWYLISRLSPEDWEALNGKIITEDFRIGLVNSTVNAFTQWLKSDEYDLTLKWNLSPLINVLSNELTKESVEDFIRSLPVCTQEELNAILLQITTRPLDQIQIENLCKLPDPFLEQQVNFFYGSLSWAENDLAAEIEISLWQDVQGVNQRDIRMIKTAFKAVGFMGEWGWILVFALLVLILVLCLPSLDDIALWLGVPFILSGTALVALAVACRGIALLGLSLPIIKGEPNLNTAINSSLLKLLDNVHHPMLWQGVGLLAIGFILFCVLLIRNLTRRSN
jgi:hypothetical protein